MLSTVRTLSADDQAVLPGFTLRRPTAKDLSAVVELGTLVARSRPGGLIPRAEDVRMRWLAMGPDDYAVLIEHADDPQPDGAEPDAADDPGARGTTLVAYAAFEVDPDADADEVTVHVDGVVHPQWTGHGVGSFLFTQAAAIATRTARESGTTHALLRTATSGEDAQASAWLAARGFTIVRHLLALRLDLHAPPPSPNWPAGVTVRPFRPGRDETLLWQAHQAAFADVPTAAALTEDELLASRLRGRAAFDPGLVLLAEHNGEVVGLTIGQAGTEVAAEDGWVRDLGVVPAFRRRGVGMALLRTAFAAFRARGLTGVALEVDDVTLLGAVALYRRAGMRVVARTDVLERPLPKVGDPDVR